MSDKKRGPYFPYFNQPSGKVLRRALLGWRANSKERNLDQNVRSNTSHLSTGEEKQTEKSSNKGSCSNDSVDKSNLSNHLGGYSLDNSVIDDANSSVLEKDTNYHEIYCEK